VNLARTGHCLREMVLLWRRRFPTLTIAVLLCASALVLPLAAATVAFSLAPQLGRIPVAPEIAVFVAPGAGQQDIAALKGRLAQRPKVAGVEWITRDQALAELARRTGTVAPLAEIKPNPLPDTLVVTLAQGVDPDEIDAAAAEFRKLPRVDSVQADSSWYRKAVGIGRVALRVALASGIATAVLLALAIVGTVRLVALAGDDELRVFRLVGAEDRLIVRPYAWTGGIALLAATAIAIGAVAGLLNLFGPDAAWLAQLLGTPIGIAMLPPPFLAGVAIAAFLIGRWGGAIGVRAALRRIG
jgi:cell division transport system permease protein